jgi:hypothetical protein
VITKQQMIGLTKRERKKKSKWKVVLVNFKCGNSTTYFNQVDYKVNARSSPNTTHRMLPYTSDHQMIWHLKETEKACQQDTIA